MEEREARVECVVLRMGKRSPEHQKSYDEFMHLEYLHNPPLSLKCVDVREGESQKVLRIIEKID